MKEHSGVDLAILEKLSANKLSYFKPIFKRINYPGTSSKAFHLMNKREQEVYMKMCKKDLLKYFNLAKKSYLAKFK